MSRLGTRIANRPDRPGTPRRFSIRRHGHAGMRTAVYLVALALVAVFVLLVREPELESSTEEASSATAATGGDSASTPDDESTPKRGDAQGRQPESQPLDQVAVPGRHWRGWSRYPAGRCAWIPNGLFARLGHVRPPDPDSTSCSVPLRDGTIVRITWGLPQSRALWPAPVQTTSEETGKHALTAVAGLDAHTSTPFILGLIFPGACRIDLNAGVTGLTVVAWNTDARKLGGDGTRCHIAETAATLVVRALVPGAGGTPWPDTPQRPAPAALLGRGPCGLLTAGAAVIDQLDHLATAETAQLTATVEGDRETCVATHGGARLRATLIDRGARIDTADGQGASDDGERRGQARAALAPLRVGVLPADREDTPGGCTITLEIIPGHQLAVFYRDDTASGQYCAAAELATAAMVQAALDRT